MRERRLCAFQLIFGDRGDILVVMLLAGIIDENVEPAQRVDRLPDGAFAKLLVTDVAANGDSAPALLLDDLFGLCRIVVLAQIENGDVRAFPANKAATARPIPLSAPVISATLPSRRFEPS